MKTTNAKKQAAPAGAWVEGRDRRHTALAWQLCAVAAEELAPLLATARESGVDGRSVPGLP